jgi:hypothetical protein
MPRYLDIEDQFSSHVKSMLKKVDEGRKVHQTANIPEAGKPLEGYVRRLFSDALPESISVEPGYFFNSQLRLSNQVDGLFCDRTTMLQLPPSEGLEQR